MFQILPPTRIFSKTFLPQKMRANNTNLTQKRERKNIVNFGTYDRKTNFYQPLGKVAPSFARNRKFSSTIFSFSKYKHNAKERTKKYRLEPKL